MLRMIDDERNGRPKFLYLLKRANGMRSNNGRKSG
jgi:hypothetical protein